MKPGVALRTAFAVLGVSLSSVTALHADLSTGLQGYWKFDNNFTDSSGNGYDLTGFGGVGFRNDGVMGQALQLPGNNSQYASRTVDDAAFNFGPSDFTIQVWANFTSVDANGTVFIEKFDGAGGPGWTLDRPVGSINTLEFFAQVGGGTQAIDVNNVNFTTDSWHQIVARRLGDTISLFYDGISIGTQAFTGSIDPTTNPLLVGTRNANDGRDISMNGGLDETAIWGRGLSDAEIAALYNNGAGLDVAAVPEPATWAIAALATAMLIMQIVRAAAFTKASSKRRRSSSLFGTAILAVTCLVFGGPLFADTISWTTWTTPANSGDPISGTISTFGGNISVIYSGEPSSPQFGYPSWTPTSTYADGVIVTNAPSADGGMIPLTGGDPNVVDTITFSQPVTNPVFSIWSLGSPGFTAYFNFANATPTIVAGGPSSEYGGNTIMVSGNSVSGEEGNGTIQFLGTYSSISWNNPVAESYYGFTVGLPIAAVPEPTTWAASAIAVMVLLTQLLRRCRSQ